MNQVFMLDKNFSTTRRVIQASLMEIANLMDQINQSGDKVDTVFLLPNGESRKGEGGLRTKCYYKDGGIIPVNGISQTATTVISACDAKPLITVVTVVYNGEEFLEETILSVINQTYDNIEYIVIDGGSTDGTLDIIKKYEHAIDYWVSEQDRGIYDAMNKGITLSTGEWINFMNGGDAFHKNTALDNVFKANKLESFDVVYGNHEVVYSSGRKRIVKSGQLKNMWKGSHFCHQAAFVKTKYHKMNKFNICTKIVADYEFFYNAWKASAIFKFVDVIVARFQSGGVSDVNRIDSILGWWLLVDKTFKVNMNYMILIFLEELKSGVKKLYSLIRH